MPNPIGQLYCTVLDCPDPWALARFYAEMIGGEYVTERPDWVTIADPAGRRLSFQRSPKYRAPVFPDKYASQQEHIDILVTDVDGAQRRALDLGATRLAGEGRDFRVFADPVGHPFCLVWE
jgi:hypothetical protein